MRILYDPKDAARQQGGIGIPSSNNTGRGGIPQANPALAPKAATAVVSAPAKKAASAGTGRASTFVTGIGLSPARFLTQLRGKLGQRTLLAGR